MAKEMYAECLKIHPQLGRKSDGCQEFLATGGGASAVDCAICGCHINYHRKTVRHVGLRVAAATHNKTRNHYHAECQKIHTHLGRKKDGCQRYSAVGSAVDCAVCGCHINFHRKVVKRALEEDEEEVCIESRKTRRPEVCSKQALPSTPVASIKYEVALNNDTPPGIGHQLYEK